MIKQPKLLILSLCTMILISVMNGTMFNVALHTIALDFALSPSQVSWMVVAYGMFFAIGSVTYGKLADLYPIKRLISFSLGLFALGSIIGFFAHVYPLVILSRIIQASGAASIPALGMMVATKFFAPEKRGYVLGLIASTVAFGSGVGPILGGFLTQFFGWHALFIVSVLPVMVLPFVRKSLPTEEGKSGQFDTKGAILFALGIASFLLGVNIHWIFFIFSFGLLLGFSRHVRLVSEPFIQIRMWQNRPYRQLLLLGWMIFISMMTSFFLLPLFLGEVNHLSAGTIGLVIFPGAMTAALLGSKLGKLSDQYGSVRMIMFGSISMASGFLLLSSLIGVAPMWISLMMVCVYLGFSTIQSALANLVAQQLDRQELGVGMGLYNLTTFLRSAMGPAFAGKFLEFDLGLWNPISSLTYANYSNTFLLIAILSLSTLYVLSLAHSNRHSLPQKGT